MAQFDLYRLGGGQLVVDLQTDLMGIDASRVVAPLRPAQDHAVFPGLTPVIEHDGTRYVIRIPELAALPGRDLGAPVGSLAHAAQALRQALSMLIDGV
ncbi:MAG: CcdB family protein [Marinibacterium sp.]|nr:CcdB family protein [Marinibacterium sp.]